MVSNLYVHFPFCRSRCSYCTLFSRTGKTPADRAAAVAARVCEIDALPAGTFSTIYFGGGSPALCDLSPLAAPLRNRRTGETEFTVELHPLDVTEAKLTELKALGVNRISMGVQSLDDDILAAMNRGYTFADAEDAFRLVKRFFDNAGIDLIVGYPGETTALTPRHARLAKWGLRHCSVYALQNERGLPDAIDDETVMNRLSITSRFLEEIGLFRYEISNYAEPGFECRHNLAVWRGEDYLGLGEGAHGRIGLERTPSGERLSPEEDLKERTLFRLRTRDGLDTTRFPQWRERLIPFVEQGLLLHAEGPVYRLTERGHEVCDTILEALV